MTLVPLDKGLKSFFLLTHDTIIILSKNILSQRIWWRFDRIIARPGDSPKLQTINQQHTGIYIIIVHSQLINHMQSHDPWGLLLMNSCTHSHHGYTNHIDNHIS